MVSCIILVGAKKWCDNHEAIVHNKGESWILYDRFPINETDKKLIRYFMQNGEFITCICITKQLGGNRNVEYIAYTPKKEADKNIIEVIHSEGEYFFDEELMKNYPKIYSTSKKGVNIPIKPPGPCPSWEDYDFVDIKIKDKVERLPRPYEMAIKITKIQAIEIPLKEFRNVRNEKSINEGQLQKSFIIARTNNIFVENFRKNNRKSNI